MAALRKEARVPEPLGQVQGTRAVEITGKAKIQIDGEYIGETPCVIESAENALSIVV